MATIREGLRRGVVPLALAAVFAATAAPVTRTPDRAHASKKRPAAGTLAPSGRPEPSPAPPGRPNLLLISFDTLRADHVSAYGYPFRTTPSVDALAEHGVLFERAYAQEPVTGPSHATALTGLYPQTHGAYRNGVRMNDKAVTLAQILSRSGYRTAAFVSGWTLRSNLTGLDRGFETYDQDFTDRYAVVNSQRPANETTNRALHWLGEQDGAAPFFLFVHYFDAHEPYDLARGFETPDVVEGAGPPPERSKKLVRYDSEISFADAHMGRVVAALRKKGWLENTLVVFMADHGEAFGEQGYNGHGRRVHEVGIRVPIIFRWPKRLAEGRRVDQLAGLVDLAPTVLDLLGAEPLASQQGMSLVSWLLPGEPAPISHRELRAVAYPGTVGHMPRWVRRIFSRKRPDFPIQMASIWDDWKYVLEPGKEEAHLYRITSDPGEARDVLGDHPEMASNQDTLVEWFEATRDEEGTTDLTAEDRERLESLGYAGPARAASGAGGP